MGTGKTWNCRPGGCTYLEVAPTGLTCFLFTTLKDREATVNAEVKESRVRKDEG